MTENLSTSIDPSSEPGPAPPKSSPDTSGGWQNALGKIIRHLPFIGEKPPLVSLIDLHGVISAGGRGKSLNLKRVEKAIDKAFSGPNLKAVGLLINSPGGSPVQSRFIMKRIRDVAAEKEIPVVAFAEDVAASGGYILACAGDEIFADDSSIIGSIGVITASFGFTEAIEKLGVERRVHTAGTNKSQLDPFQPEKPEDIENLKDLLDTLHDQFIALVRERRGEQLADDDEIFSGRVFSAPDAMTKGLIDGLGDYRAIFRNRFGDKVKFNRVPVGEKSLLGKIGVESPSVVDPEATLEALEAKSLWARYGM